MQEGQGVDELPRVLGGGGLVEAPAGGLLQGLVEFRGGVLHDEEEPVRVVEVAMAGHDVRVLDPAVDLHLCVCKFLFVWEGGGLVDGVFGRIRACMYDKAVGPSIAYLVADLVHHAVRLELLLEEHLSSGGRGMDMESVSQSCFEIGRLSRPAQSIKKRTLSATIRCDRLQRAMYTEP